MFASHRATILHADLDSFYASVEQRDDPRLRGRPVIVGGGIVLAASYEAKAHGVRTAMGEKRARRLCPQAVVVPPRFRAYVDASKAVFRVFDDASPVVEGISIDEAFLDVRGLERISGTPREIAVRLRRDGPRGGRATDHRRGRAHEVPREGRERRRKAGRPARGPARRRARVPPPAADRAAVGRRAGHGGEAPPRAGSRRSARSRAFPSPRSSGCSAVLRAGTSMRSRTTVTHGRSFGGAGAARSARSARSAVGAARRRRSTRS